MDVEAGKYFDFGTARFGRLCDTLAEQYGVDQPICRMDVKRSIGEMSDSKLVAVSSRVSS